MPPISQIFKCPQCGRHIPADARTLGLCPYCLISRALESGVPDPVKRPPPPSIAEVAADLPRYEIRELLGHGGMGAVYKAREPRLDRLVALKIFRLDPHADPAAAERFAQEARVLARLSDPRIVGAYEYGTSPHFAYLAMELVPGPNLRTCLHNGPLPPDLALRVAAEICAALATAHSQFIVHRDIKPENILIHPPADTPPDADLAQLLHAHSRIRVADFGLAKTQLAPHSFSLTSPEHCLGTAVYMAPEQAERRPIIDARADLYSLGVILYEMLTGELPLGRFAPPSRKAKVPRAFDRIVLRCLENDPARRYQSAADLLHDLHNVQRRRWDILIPLAAAAIFLLVCACWLYFASAANHTSTVAPTTPPSIAEATTTTPRPSPQTQPSPQLATATHPSTPAQRPTPTPPSALSESPIVPPPPAALPPSPSPSPQSSDLTSPQIAGSTPTSPDTAPPPGFSPPSEFLAPPGQRFGFRPNGFPFSDLNHFYQPTETPAGIKDDARYAGDRGITVYIDEIPGNMGGFFPKRLSQLAGTKTWRSHGVNNIRDTVQLASTIAPADLAKKIDFGTVASINTAARYIWVHADPKKTSPAASPRSHHPLRPHLLRTQPRRPRFLG